LYPAGQLTQPPAQPRDPLMTNLDKHRPTLFAVEIRTSRWPELVAWYREVLGLEVLLRVVDDRGPARRGWRFSAASRPIR